MLNSTTNNEPTGQNPNTGGSTHMDWREQRRAWREERRQERNRHPLHGLFPGLALVLLGGLFLLNQAGIIVGDTWWQTLLIGLGVIAIINGVVHAVIRDRTHRGFGSFVAGAILISIGALFMAGFGFWWPIVLIAIGLVILSRMFWGRR